MTYHSPQPSWDGLLPPNPLASLSPGSYRIQWSLPSVFKVFTSENLYLQIILLPTWDVKSCAFLVLTDYSFVLWAYFCFQPPFSVGTIFCFLVFFPYDNFIWNAIAIFFCFLCSGDMNCFAHSGEIGEQNCFLSFRDWIPFPIVLKSDKKYILVLSVVCLLWFTLTLFICSVSLLFSCCLYLI